MSLIKEDPNLNLTWAFSVIETLVQANCNQFFISPGLRNTPLIKAIIENDNTKYYIGIDERAMAYRALGCFKITNEPSVLICTSGTALANYFPAVIESFKSNIPLIILSADRPKELIWAHANQSIHQENIFGKYVADSINLECPNFEFDITSMVNHIHYKIEEAKMKKLPLHINMPFREPLTQTNFTFNKDHIKPCKIYFKNTLKQTSRPPYQLPSHLEALIEKSKKPLLTFGSLSISESKLIQKTSALKILKYFDITSNLKLNYCCDDLSIPSFDHQEVNSYFIKNPPDLIIHFGGNMTSKTYSMFLKNNPKIPLVSIGNEFLNKFTFNNDSTYLNIDLVEIDIILPTLLDHLERKDNQNIFNHLNENKSSLIEESEISTPWISKNIVEQLPNQSLLYIGNSTIIRSFDLYTSQSKRKYHQVLYNRGVSGIEGFIASAVGSAQQIFPKPIYLIIGDITFLHDLNSLMLINSKTNLKIIIINNYSGGIFSLLPMSQEKPLLDIISTRHNIEFKEICHNFKVPYSSIKSKDDFQKVISSYQKVTNHIFEVKLEEKHNTNMYKNLKSIK